MVEWTVVTVYCSGLHMVEWTVVTVYCSGLHMVIVDSQ